MASPPSLSPSLDVSLSAVSTASSTATQTAASTTTSGFLDRANWPYIAFAVGGVAIFAGSLWFIANNFTISVSKTERSNKRKQQQRLEEQLRQRQQQQHRRAPQQAASAPKRGAPSHGPPQSTSDSYDMSKEERKCLVLLKALLEAKGVDAQIEVIDTFHVMSRDSRMHDIMRDAGVLACLLQMLTRTTPEVSHSPSASSSQRIHDYEKLMVSIVRVISNLAANKINRPLIAETSAIRDLLGFIKNSPSNEELCETSLRALMNLAISTENEDKIRTEGGLPIFIDLLKDPQATPKILLQNLRVLVNLSANETNRAIMIKEGAPARVLELLNSSTDQEVLYRLFRLLGALSVGAEPATYEKMASPAVAVRLLNVLRGMGHPSRQSKEDKSLSEVLLITIWKLSTERGPKYRAITEKFQNCFLSDEGVSSSSSPAPTGELADMSGLNLLFLYVTSDDPNFISSGINALYVIGKNNEQVKEKVREHRSWTTLEALATSSTVANIRDRAAEIVRDFSALESLD
jgi:hypothetical protein